VFCISILLIFEQRLKFALRFFDLFLYLLLMYVGEVVFALVGLNHWGARMVREKKLALLAIVFLNFVLSGVMLHDTHQTGLLTYPFQLYPFPLQSKEL
jgi:hypothetical protein